MNCKLLLVFLACSAALAAETGAELFQKALVQERAAGNLEEAIKIYQRVAREYSKDRSLAARALVQAARCYEKLGQDKAVAIYQQVARDFADQREEASIAREALAKSRSGKGAEAEAMSSHQIPMPLSACLILQSDGRRVFYLDCRTRDLMATSADGTADRVILKRESGGRIGGFASAKLSPDEKRIVFTLTDSSRKQSLAIINTDGSGLRTVSALAAESLLDVQDWSPDGRNFLAVVVSDDQNRWLARVSVADGSVRKLFPIGPAKEFYVARYSRDGQYIAWTQRATASDAGDVQIAAATEGARPHVLIDQPAALVDWTPDGRYALFISDRNGSPAIFAQAVAGGQAQGKPVFVTKTYAHPGTAWVGRAGTLMYRTRTGRTDVFQLSFGAAEPEPVSKQAVTRRISPVWSPDGRKLAFMSVKGGSDEQELILTIRDETSGRERNIPIRDYGIGTPRLLTWTSNDNIAFSWNSDGQVSFAEMDLGSAALRRVPGALNRKELHIPSAETPQGFWTAPNGNLWLEFYEGQGVNQAAVRAGLWEIDRMTGRVTELISKPKAFRVVMSPDGLQSAALERRDDHTAAISVRPASGGEWRKFLYFVQGTDSDLGLWRVAAGGGQPERVANLPGMGTIDSIQVHPNERGAVVQSSAYRSEVWALRNYLPKEKLATAAKAR